MYKIIQSYPIIVQRATYRSINSFFAAFSSRNKKHRDRRKNLTFYIHNMVLHLILKNGSYAVHIISNHKNTFISTAETSQITELYILRMSHGR